ncbi:MAG: FumA C-terminus/TtdB family hydratase beta subunit [Sphaerochaetaceae bacterium]
MSYKVVRLPLTKEEISNLKPFDMLLLEGKLIVARDQAHKLLAILIEKNEPLPLELADQVIYYMGPAKKGNNLPIGSCGPTTAGRMDRFTPTLMDRGVKVTIGKGPRNQAVVESIIANKGLYLVAYGGCGALYATKVISQKVIAFEELGPEAILEIEVKDFPVIVGIDSQGNSIY